MRPNRTAPSWRLSRRLLRLVISVVENIGPSLASMHWHVPREEYAELCDRCPAPDHPERLIPHVRPTKAERALWAQLDLDGVTSPRVWECPHA